MTSTTIALAPVTFLELEISTYCQLQCRHCYNASGPAGDTGSMTAPAWKRVITEAAALGVEAVQFIGGEPTLYPGLRELVHFALSAGLTVDHARAVGRAAHGRPTTLEDLCGRCGDGRAAISSHGAVSPCVLGRHLVAGNVKDAPLGVLPEGAKWREIVDSIPRRDACVTCTPADSNDCDPSRRPRL